MIIVELTYKKSLEEVNQYLDEHRLFLKKYYDEGIFVVSGPKQTRDGGIIVVLSDKVSMQEIIKEDPFFQNDIAEYRVISFEPTKYSDQFKFLVNK